MVTIYMSEPVGSRFGQMASNIQNWQVSCRNRVYHLELHLPKYGREGLKLVSKMAFKKWNTNFGWNIPIGKTGLLFQTFRCSRKFSTETIRNVVFHQLSNRIFRTLFVNGKQPVPVK